MELTDLMKIAMPHMKVNASSDLNLFSSLLHAPGSGKSRNKELSYRTLMLASMTNGYVEGSSQLTGVSGQTVRNYIRNINPGRLLRINNDMIATLREMGVLKKPLMLALDWHDGMYYGAPGTDGVIGTKNSRGTNYAYEYATISIVTKGLRFSIAIIPVRERSILNMVRTTIHIVSNLDIKIKVLLMDGGFFSIDAINYLISNNINFIMHVPKMEKGNMEIDKLYTTKNHNRKKGEQATFRFVTVYGRDKNGKIMLYAFATSTTLPSLSILRIFKKRWGIETGYRMIRKFLAKTTSRIYTIRMLYFFLAVLLYNFWVILNIKFRMRIIADVLRIMVASVLVTVNPFATHRNAINFHLENKGSGGDF